MRSTVACCDAQRTEKSTYGGEKETSRFISLHGVFRISTQPLHRSPLAHRAKAAPSSGKPTLSIFCVCVFGVRIFLTASFVHSVVVHTQRQLITVRDKACKLWHPPGCGSTQWHNFFIRLLPSMRRYDNGCFRCAAAAGVAHRGDAVVRDSCQGHRQRGFWAAGKSQPFSRLMGPRGSKCNKRNSHACVYVTAQQTDSLEWCVCVLLIRPGSGEL